MTYQAKWLPIEGKIKEGDMVMNTSQGADHRWKAGYEIKEYAETTKRCKFFIISTNIKAGDVLKECCIDGLPRKVHHFETVLPHGIYVFEPWPSNKEEWIQADQAFRVIGEISYNATWVQEGDKFKEEDLAIGFTNMHGRLTIEETYLIFSEDEYKKYNMPFTRILIKGACGHFH